MTRITENQLNRSLITHLTDQRKKIFKLNEEISSGLKVVNPGDSNSPGSISNFQQTLTRVKTYENRIASVSSNLQFQDDVLGQAQDIVLRAKEIAMQAANETNGVTTRAQAAQEVWQLRDHMVSLANSTYQGKFVFGGVDDDDAPYDATTYTTPASGPSSQRYVYDTDAGSTGTRTVRLADDLTITTNTPGNRIFDNAIQALERLGRALQGYETLPASGAPDGTGAQFNLPNELNRQTQAIQGSIEQLDLARQSDILPEKIDLAGRMRRVETAQSLLKLGRESAQDALDIYQNTDMFESASMLTQAQTALQASLQVASRIMDLTIMDVI